jgi:TetR/AcrR family transcriptional regulator, transcriptional repressor for nem operon
VPRKSDAKEHLMDAAMDLIWANSYGCTSVDSICEKAGAKKGSFYYFFKSKSELAVKALEADWLGKKPWFDENFSAPVPPLDRLRGYFDHVYEAQMKKHDEGGAVLGCPYFTLGCETSTQDRAICEQVHKILQRNEKYFESAIRDAHAQGLIFAPDAKMKAKMLMAFFQGSVTNARIQNDPRLLRELTSGAMSLLGAEPAVA